MKHRRSIELLTGHPDVRPTKETLSLNDVAEWFILYGKCSGCGHVGHIDRWDLARQRGRARPFLEMLPLLRCTRCGNRRDNNFCISKMPR